MTCCRMSARPAGPGSTNAAAGVLRHLRARVGCTCRPAGLHAHLATQWTGGQWTVQVGGGRGLVAGQHMWPGLTGARKNASQAYSANSLFEGATEHRPLHELLQPPALPGQQQHCAFPLAAAATWPCGSARGQREVQQQLLCLVAPLRHASSRCGRRGSSRRCVSHRLGARPAAARRSSNAAACDAEASRLCACTTSCACCCAGCTSPVLRPRQQAAAAPAAAAPPAAAPAERPAARQRQHLCTARGDEERPAVVVGVVVVVIIPSVGIVARCCCCCCCCLAQSVPSQDLRAIRCAAAARPAGCAGGPGLLCWSPSSLGPADARGGCGAGRPQRLQSRGGEALGSAASARVQHAIVSTRGTMPHARPSCFKHTHTPHLSVRPAAAIRLPGPCCQGAGDAAVAGRLA